MILASYIFSLFYFFNVVHYFYCFCFFLFSFLRYISLQSILNCIDKRLLNRLRNIYRLYKVVLVQMLHMHYLCYMLLVHIDGTNYYCKHISNLLNQHFRIFHYRNYFPIPGMECLSFDYKYCLYNLFYIYKQRLFDQRLHKFHQ